MNTHSAPFPHLGFGLGLRIPHYAHILEHRPRVDWFEIISENFMDTQGKARRNLARIRADYPIVMHGVSLSIGSVDPLQSDYLRQLKQLAQDIEPAWISDHLCWTGVAHQNLHDLLPVPYTEEALRHIVSRVQQVQDVLGRPIALENPSTYLEFSSSQMNEAEFLTALARQSGCHLLLDVNNVYVSCFNHGQDPCQYLDALDMDRVVQIHLSGHSHCGTHIIDTHDAPVADPVWALYQDVLARAGRVPNTMIEWDAQIPAWDLLYAELERAQALAAQMHPASAKRPRPMQGLAGAGAENETECETETSASTSTSTSTQARTPRAPLATLALEQQRLQHAILAGEAEQPQSSPWVRARPAFSAQAQLGVYRHAYRARLFEVTAEDYPVLQHDLGADRFTALIDAYVKQTASVHFNIARYSTGLPGHVARQLPQDVFAQELATLEDAICQLHDAEESPALTPAHLTGLTEEALQHAVLSPRRAARLLAFEHPVDAYYTAVREGQTPARPGPQKSWLLVYRHEDVVWRMPLECPEFLLLQALFAGMPVGQACSACAAAHAPDVDLEDTLTASLAASISRWFSRWIRNGVIRHPLATELALH